MNVQLDPGAYMPDRAHVPDAGADLFTPVDFTLYGNSHKTIDTAFTRGQKWSRIKPDQEAAVYRE